jgi:hypothetical protein
MRLLSLAAGIAALLCLAAAAPAGAISVAPHYHGTVDTGDHTAFFRVTDANAPTSCSTAVTSTAGDFAGTTYDEYAFRNDGATSTCVTMTENNTSCSSPTVGSSFAGPGSFLGSDPAACATPSHSHSFNLAAGQPFVEQVSSDTLGSAYDLFYSGASVVPVHLVQVAGADLGDGNNVRLTASSLEDGTGLTGTLNVSAGIGHSYGGTVRCLRVSGENASIVVPFNAPQTTGLDAKWKGVVYWIHQSLDGFTDGQRNSLLTQQQLDTTYASCPDPDAPIKGSFRDVSAGNEIRVVSNGPLATTP